MPEPMATAADREALAVPASLGALFLAFTRLALQGFGGVIAVAQRELVERLRWLTREQFVELLSTAQVLPGPNVVNLSLMIGDRFFGWRGAVAALAGMIAAPLVVVIAMTALYGHYAGHPRVDAALRGMGAVAAGLIIATALKLALALRASALGRPLAGALAAVTIAAVAWWRLPLAVVILGLGPLAVAAAWWRLGARRP